MRQLTLILLTVVLAFTWHLAFSQSDNAAQHLLLQAENNMVMADHRAALKHFEEASAQFLKTSDIHQYIQARLKMAECRIALGEVMQAGTLLTETRAYKEPPDANTEALAMMVQAQVHLRTGRNDLALEELLKAVTMLAPGSMDLAKCYNDLGVTYWNNGNRELALQYHQRALALRQDSSRLQTTPAQRAILQADSYNNMGLVYLGNLPSYSAEFFAHALDRYKSHLGPNHPKVANTLSNIAFTYAAQSLHDKALQHLDMVMTIWNETYPGDHANKAFTVSNKGRISEMKGAYDEALEFQGMALQMYKRLYGEKHPEIANTLVLIGNVYKKKSDYKSAVDYFQQSIYANLYNQTFSSPYDLPELRDYYNADILLSSLQSKASSMEALHFENTLKLRDIDGALSAYLACDELITQIRQIRLNEADKLRLGALAAEIYENGISTALYLSEHTLKRKHYRKLAFNFCERSKSAVLHDAINDTRAKHFAGIPDDKLATEDSLKDQVIILKQRLTEATEKTEEKAIESELFQYEAALRNFIQQLEENYPDYYRLKYNTSLANVESVQSLLPESVGMLAYLVGEKAIYAFLITGKKYKAFRLKKTDDFQKNIMGLRNSIKYRLPEPFRLLSETLRKQLLPPIPSTISSLVILPDGLISTIPFESFVTGKNGSQDYLLENFSISYDYSASLLSERIQNSKISESRGILLSAPISFAKNELLMPTLPDTEKEVNEIKYLFEGTEHDVTIALNASATEYMIKSGSISGYKYLHFATHGMVNESYPELSRLFLTPGNEEDGSLYSGEIYNLRLNADLVNLSACETGLGKVTRGEGIIGLSRALMFAGAKNLIVSLWQVADASTAELMIEFYNQHLHHSPNNRFNDDLRNAKLKLLKSQEYKDPYYWAPFILVGL